MATVLAIDRDRLHLELLSFLLKQDGHSTFGAQEPETAFEILRTRAIDLVTIETAGQRQDGVRLCQQIRQLNPRTPMIIVSGDTQEDHIVRGLTSAADDYITKPFSPRELLARVHAVLRRASLTRSVTARDDSIVIGDVTLDQQRMSVIVRGMGARLTPREISLLRTFMENPDRVLTREQLMAQAWGDRFVATTKAVDVYVLRLRQKMRSSSDSDGYIQSLRGFGYRFTAAVGDTRQRDGFVIGSSGRSNPLVVTGAVASRAYVARGQHRTER